MGHDREPTRFDMPDLVAVVEAMTQAEIDTLPFGAVRLDANGMVTSYSEVERQESRSGDRARVGRNFFTEVAPCLDTPAFRGRIEQARRRGGVDIEYNYVYDFPEGEREVTVRVLSASNGEFWMFSLWER
nr:hypothetical protein [uncultured Lichenicoccus sp.]